MLSCIIPTLFAYFVACHPYIPYFLIFNSTADVNTEETRVIAGLLPVNVSGSVVASKVWKKRGKPLVDSEATIEGNITTTKRTMRYQIDNGQTEKTQFNRVQEKYRTWQDREVTKNDGRETYRQSEATVQRPLDVLLVVDTSGSMSDKRRGLGTRLSKLLTHIDNSNWRLAITTTDAGQCLLQKWIISKRQGVFNRDQDDFNAIISGDNQSGDTGEIRTITGNSMSESGIADDERPILMAINGLGGNEVNRSTETAWCRGRRSTTTLNSDWLAQDSMIAVILVTDEDNSESGTGRDLATSQLTDYLQNTLARTKGVSYQIYGLLNLGDKASYENIIDSDNIQNVESTDYDTVLSRVSGSIMRVLNKKLDISNIASTNGFVFDSLSVAGVKKTKGTDYTISGNIITFMDGHVPAKNQEIVVNYSYTERATVKAHGLSYTPLDTVTVTKVSGCGSWQSNHSVGVCRGGMPCVIHRTRPPNNCRLKYVYKRDDLKLTNTIELQRPNDNCEIDESTIKLTVGGASRQYSHTKNNNDIRVSFTPQDSDDGKQIVATYKCRKKILSYPYTNRDGASITCKKNDDIAITCSNDDGKMVTILESDFEDGVSFNVERPAPPENKRFELEDGYVADSLSLKVTDSSEQQTTCDSSKLVIENDEVLLDTIKAKQKCSVLDNMHKVSLTYQRQQEHLFEVGNDFFNDNPHNDERWQVVIGGEQLEDDDYEVDKEARTVKLKSAPTPGAEIEIKVDLLW